MRWLSARGSRSSRVSELETFQTVQKSGLLAADHSRAYFDAAEFAAVRIEEQVAAMRSGLSQRERG